MRAIVDAGAARARTRLRKLLHRAGAGRIRQDRAADPALPLACWRGWRRRRRSSPSPLPQGRRRDARSRPGGAGVAALASRFRSRTTSAGPGNWRAPCDCAMRKHGWGLSASPSRLRIQTIDSLCAGLTRQMPVLSGFGAQPETLTDPAPLLVEAARRTLAQLDEGGRMGALHRPRTDPSRQRRRCRRRIAGAMLDAPRPVAAARGRPQVT